MTSFNGGRSQVNLNFPQVGGDYPFLNNLKNSQAWSLADNAGSPSPADLDANGYLLNGSNAAVSHGGLLTVFVVPNATNAGTTQYACQATGKGQLLVTGSIVTIAVSTITPGATTAIDFGTSHHFTVGMEAPVTGVSGTLGTALNGNGPFVVQSITATGIVLTVNTVGTTGSGGTVAYGSQTIGVVTGGRFIIDVAAAPAQGSALGINFFHFNTDATNPITSIAFVRLGNEETRYNAGEQFGIDFLTKLASLNAGVIRFLNTANTNITLETTWATRKSQTYYSYGSGTFLNSIYAGVATNASNTTQLDYLGTLGTGGPVDKQQYILAYPCQSVTVSNGANATVSWTGHGLSVGMAFNLFGNHGSVAPGGMPFQTAQNIAQTYFVKTVVDANHITFSTTQGGSAITTTSSGSGSLFAQRTVIETNVTFTASSSTINWPLHNLSPNEPVMFDGQGSLPVPPNFNINGIFYYVKTVIDANNITVSATPVGTAIVAGAGTVTNQPVGVRLLTYNINGTGAIPILNQNGNACTSSYFTDASSVPRARLFGTAVEYGILTYDAVLGAYISSGSTDGAQGTSVLQNYWPPEVCLALCAHPLICAHLWMPLGGLMADPLTDYPGSFATYCKNNKPSWMIVRHENINEFWNGQFWTTLLMIAHGTAYVNNGTWGAPSGLLVDEIAGKIASVLGQAIHNAYGGAVGAGYQMVTGVQTASMTDAGQAAFHNPRLTSALYAAQSAAPQSPYTKSAASNWMTHVCCAQYIVPSDEGTGNETTESATFNAVSFVASMSGTTMTVTSTAVGSLASGMVVFGQGIATPFTISGSGPNWTMSTSLTLPSGPFYAGTSFTPVQTYIDTLVTGSGQFYIPALNTIYGVTATWAAGFTNNAGNTLKMNGYEGGYSPDYTANPPGSTQLDLFRNAGKYVAALQGYTTLNYNNFIGAGGEFPSCFQFTGGLPTNNVWAILEDIYQSPLPPQFLAIAAYNAVQTVVGGILKLRGRFG